MFTGKIVKSEKVYEGFVDVYQHTLKNGKIYEEHKIHNAVCIALVPKHEEEKKMLFVEQYRPNAKRNTLEIPAGIMDKGLSAYDTALEELEEEAGINLHHMINRSEIEEHMVKYNSMMGLSSCEVKIFPIVINFKEKEKYLEFCKKIETSFKPNNETIATHLLSQEQIEEKINEGKISGAKEMLAYYKFVK